MLIATITALVLLLGGGGTFAFDALMDSFEAAISDDARLDQIEVILEAADDDLESFRDRISGDWADRVEDIHGNYHATREQYHEIFAEIDTERAALQQRLIDRRFAIKKLLTAEEWAAYQADLAARRADS